MKRMILPLPEKFFSYLDQKIFIKWLKEIDAISLAKEENSRLILDMVTPIDDTSLWDLIALLWRYEIEMSELKNLSHAGNRSWFINTKAYWYKKIFKATKTKSGR